MTRSDLIWLDLCSGLGGASQPALDRGWKVIRVDIDPRFKPDIVADVRSLPLKPFHIDVLWASPPCTEFSKHGRMRTFYPNAALPEMSTVQAIIEIVDEWRPDWWIVENVSGARQFFAEVIGLGRWKARSGSHYFWGHLPGLIPQTATHKGGDYKSFKDRISRLRKAHSLPENWKGSKPDYHHVAAKIPYEIGEAICIAVERRMGVYEPLRDVH